MPHLRKLFQTLPRYEPERDLTLTVMARIEAAAHARVRRRVVLSILGLSGAASGLVGYRWYTFFALRDYSAVVGNLLEHASHVSESLTIGYWVQGFQLVRTSLPMVETTLALVVLGTLGILVWKCKALWRTPAYTYKRLAA